SEVPNTLRWDLSCAMNSKLRAGATALTSCLTLLAALPTRGWQSHEEGLAREQELPRERVCCERVHWQRSGVSEANGTKSRKRSKPAQFSFRKHAGNLTSHARCCS